MIVSWTWRGKTNLQICNACMSAVKARCMQSWNQIENGAPKGSVLILYLSFKISSQHGWTLNSWKNSQNFKHMIKITAWRPSETTVRNSFSLFCYIHGSLQLYTCFFHFQVSKYAFQIRKPNSTFSSACLSIRSSLKPHPLWVTLYIYQH